MIGLFELIMFIIWFAFLALWARHEYRVSKELDRQEELLGLRKPKQAKKRGKRL